MKICVVTGGSGGHIFPALSYADYVRSVSEHEVFFIGNNDRMEASLVPQAGYAFYSIDNKGLQGSRWDKVKAVVSQVHAYRMAKVHLKKLKPDVVFAFGGYVSAPVVMAAKRLKLPIILHEQNAYVGKANKMVARYADAIITCYKEAFAGHDRVYLLGNPRGSLDQTAIDHCPEFERIGLEDRLRTVLLVMGSQGSPAMNRIFLEYIEAFDIDDLQVVIVSGPKYYQEMMAQVKDKHPQVAIESFVDQKALLSVADLVVCRSGASTIAEIASFGVASLLIPSPHVANNHQYFNAKSLHDAGACEMIAESKLSGAVLNALINGLMADDMRLQELRDNVKKLATPHAVSDIFQLVEKVVSDYEKK